MKEKDTDEAIPDLKKQQNIEMKSLGNIIGGFCDQSIGMPIVYLRFLKLDGEFTLEDTQEAIALYKTIMKNILSGHNLTVTQLACMYVLSELVLQRKDALLDSTQPVIAEQVDERIGYV